MEHSCLATGKQIGANMKGFGALGKNVKYRNTASIQETVNTKLCTNQLFGKNNN